MIPKIIWQTYEVEYEKLPKYIKDCTETYQINNPDWEYRYMSEEQRSNFVLQEYGSEWHQIYKDFPYNIMRADLWRYLIIYKYGGLYTDIDSVCKISLNHLITDNYKMIVFFEDDLSYFSQGTFAAEPKSEIINSVLQSIKNICKNPNYDEPHFVHKIVGPAIWTYGIMKYLKIDNNVNLFNDYQIYNNKKEAIESGFLSYGGEHGKLIYNNCIKHLYGSIWWNQDYDQWVKQVPYKFEGNGDVPFPKYEEWI